MTIFSAAATKDLALIVSASLVMAMVVNGVRIVEKLFSNWIW